VQAPGPELGLGLQSARSEERVTASSRARLAPEPWCGVVACAESPRRQIWEETYVGVCKWWWRDHFKGGADCGDVKNWKDLEALLERIV
jgi:hypothetical protein